MPAYCPYCAGDLSAYTNQKSINCLGCGKKLYRGASRYEGRVWMKTSPRILIVVAIITIVLIILTFLLKPEWFIRLGEFLDNN